MSWVIDKTFEFCYGHRVWTQLLDGRYSDDLKCACRHLHGHEAKVQVYLTSTGLNDQGMVTDFRHLEWLKRWLNEYVDHKFIIDINDPLLPLFVSDKLDRIPVQIELADNVVNMGWRVAIPDTTTHMQEMLGGLLLVDFPPTSEHLSRWLATGVQRAMNIPWVRVSAVDWWETPKSRSRYVLK